MGLDWKKLVEERNAWVAHNFPREVNDQPGLGSMFGVIEELGELTHSHLKEDQQIRGSSDEHQEAAKDAVGDLSVYLMGLMNLWGCTPRPVVRTAEAQTAHHALLRLTDVVGRLAYDFLWSVGGQPDVSWIAHWLREYCRHRGWNYEQIVQNTWDHVKQRDWVKYPENGLPPIPTEVQWDEESLA